MRIDHKYYDNFEVVKWHPFGDFVPPNTRLLIIGSFPTHHRNYKLTFPFYYAGIGNMFWPIFSNVFNHSFRSDKGDPAVSERKDYLQGKRIGFTDMLEKCYRHQGGSQDHQLYPIKFNDIFKILNDNTSIGTLIFTGRQRIIGPIGLFETYCHQHNIQPPTLRLNDQKIKEGSFNLNGRYFEVLVPYSTSRTVMEEDRTDERELTSMYTTCLT